MPGRKRSSSGLLTRTPALHYCSSSTACSILFTVVSRPSTSNVSNNGGAFLRPQTATRIGWNICPAFTPISWAAARRV